RAEKKLVAENIPLDVLYEDEGFLAINKPAGMIVHPGAGNWTGTVVNALLSRGADLSRGYEEQRPGIVHRLDKDTSGILLVAKNDRMHAALADLFTQRHIDKRYIGICAGKRPLAQEIIDAPIARSRSNPILRTVHHHGKAAQTEYELVWFQSGISVLHFRLHTGRTHQIRVHCRYAGFPILADASYGGDRGMIQRLQPLQRPLAYRVLKCFDRHALHAQSLSFVHPLTEEQVNIQAPIPEDFRNAFDVMGLESV
ncbi:MAG: RluA family pseudouridine synthase, partial [Fibrobacterota bacterium]